MNSNPNKIIRAVALLTAVCAVLCACDRTKPAQNETTTQPTTSQTAQSTTQEPTTVPVETTTEEPTTAEPSTTSAPRPTRPSTTKAETTEAVTKPVRETTTRHENALVNALITADKIASYQLITKDEINDIAAEMADSSEIYYVRLQDGTKTYYMAVDLQTAQALALSNPQVLRELCRQLDEKQQQMADEDEEYVLMDYTHLVGELEVHYLGYLLTGALGAESGALASFYNSCKVADLNIDESRFGPIIDIIGTIYS